VKGLSHPVRQGKVTRVAIQEFQRTIYQHYAKHGRQLPWRSTSSPYRILVSEFMLQQTQVDRVLSKYDQFIARFPDINCVAHAPLRDILAVWQGLGYNRRAANLHRTAQRVVQEFRGTIPDRAEVLRTFPGIGPATAGAIEAFAFHKPAVFIETNIRRVFIHFFFPGADCVTDNEILPLVEMTLDRKSPRPWYYALMDYGVMLGNGESNPNKRSAHYRRQAPFHGSDRQIRGLIVKTLVKHPLLAVEELVRSLPGDPERTRTIIGRLKAEGMVTATDNGLSISSGSDSPDSRRLAYTPDAPRVSEDLGAFPLVEEPRKG
jgi:A/G-specific adenine glycosylase